MVAKSVKSKVTTRNRPKKQSKTLATKSAKTKAEHAFGDDLASAVKAARKIARKGVKLMKQVTRLGADDELKSARRKPAAKAPKTAKVSSAEKAKAPAKATPARTAVGRKTSNAGK